MQIGFGSERQVKVTGPDNPKFELVQRHHHAIDLAEVVSGRLETADCLTLACDDETASAITSSVCDAIEPDHLRLTNAILDGSGRSRPDI
jgi:hypothetical protein